MRAVVPDPAAPGPSPRSEIALPRRAQAPPTEQARLRAPEGAGAVVRRLTGLPNAQVRGLFDHGCVAVNGAVCETPGTALVAGDRVEVRRDPARRYGERPRARGQVALRVVHEDAHLIVVDKPAGVLSVPNKGERDTLLAALRHYLGRGRRTPPRVFIVHRLDRDTSGLLVFAKTLPVAKALKAQFAARKPARRYVAVVAGRVAAGHGTFRSRLATDPDLNQHSTEDEQSGKPAVTHYRVLRHLAGATAVEVTLETGRRNQIRVHFAEAGHPVLGDTRYRPRQARHPLWKQRRLALHAAELGFAHPVSGTALRCTAPVPEALAVLLHGPAGPPRSAGSAPRRGR